MENTNIDCLDPFYANLSCESTCEASTFKPGECCDEENGVHMRALKHFSHHPANGNINYILSDDE